MLAARSDANDRAAVDDVNVAKRRVGGAEHGSPTKWQDKALDVDRITLEQGRRQRRRKSPRRVEARGVAISMRDVTLS